MLEAAHPGGLIDCVPAAASGLRRQFALRAPSLGANLQELALDRRAGEVLVDPAILLLLQAPANVLGAAACTGLGERERSFEERGPVHFLHIGASSIQRQRPNNGGLVSGGSSP